MTDPPYGQDLPASLARVFALFDLQPGSPTYGCGDRSYWYYRSLVNFAGATWQQPMLGLALLANRPDLAGGTSSDRLRQAANAALAFWARLVHPGGALDEWYRNEQSYCPTAFTAAAAGLTILELGDDLTVAHRQKAVGALQASGRYLEQHWNDEVYNQNLAAALALFALARVTGEARWQDAAARAYARIAQAQSSEGWFPEYGGADFGYATLALDLLAAGDRAGAGDMVVPLAQPLLSFLGAASTAATPFPGRLGSRGTNHVFCYGAEHFAGKLAGATALAHSWRNLHAERRLTGPATTDDRYFSYFYFNSWVLAAATARPDLPHEEDEVAPPPCSRLPEAGLTVWRNDGWSVVCSAHLADAFAVSVDGKTPACNLGYEIETSSGTRLSTAVWTTRAEGAAASFSQLFATRPLDRWDWAFVVFTRLLASTWLSRPFQAWVKKLAVTRKRAAKFSLERDVEVTETGVEVQDLLIAHAGAPAIACVHPAIELAVYSPSARLDWGEGLAPDDWNPRAAAEELTREGKLRVRWSVSLASHRSQTNDAGPSPSEQSSNVR